jgi:hypothetical protein
VLIANGVPTAFISGYGPESVDRRFQHIPLMQKPLDRQVLLDLFNLVGMEKEVISADGETAASVALTDSKVARL